MTDPNLPAVPPNDGTSATPPAAPVPPAAAPAPQPGYDQQAAAGSVPAGAPQYGAPQYGAPQYSAPQYGTPEYGAPQYGAPAAEAKYNVLAIVSLVSAFFVGLVAIITGHIALSQIKRTGEKGRGLAIAGLVLGYLSVLAFIILMIVLIPFLIYVASHPEQYSTY